MPRETITPPAAETSDTETVLRTLTEAYGNPATESQRSNLTYDYEAWQDALHTAYPIENYDVVLNVVDDYTTPGGLGTDETQDITPTEQFEGVFLRHALADMIATAYINNRLETVLPAVFDRLYETHDYPGESGAASVTIGALGAVHPDIDYQQDVLHAGVFDSFAGLFTHLQLIWAVAPSRGRDYYEDILSNGHELLDAATGDPADSENGDWYAELAGAFAGSIAVSPDRPLGFRKHAFTRADAVLDTAGYPHDENAYQELADVTVRYVTLPNMHQSLRTPVVEQSSADL